MDTRVEHRLARGRRFHSVDEDGELAHRKAGQQKIQARIAGKTVVKVIHVPDRMVSFVVKG